MEPSPALVVAGAAVREREDITALLARKAIEQLPIKPRATELPSCKES